MKKNEEQLFRQSQNLASLIFCSKSQDLVRVENFIL